MYAPTINAEEAEVEWFYEDLKDLLTPKKGCPFHYRRLECKSESQEIPGVIGKFVLEVQNKAGQGLTEFTKRMHWSLQTPYPTTQEKTLHMDIIRWSVWKSD